MKQMLPARPGFDLTTRDSYFTILVEVFTNHILAKKIHISRIIQSDQNIKLLS